MWTRFVSAVSILRYVKIVFVHSHGRHSTLIAASCVFPRGFQTTSAFWSEFRTKRMPRSIQTNTINTNNRCFVRSFLRGDPIHPDHILKVKVWFRKCHSSIQSEPSPRGPSPTLVSWPTAPPHPHGSGCRGPASPSSPANRRGKRSRLRTWSLACERSGQTWGDTDSLLRGTVSKR